MKPEVISELLATGGLWVMRSWLRYLLICGGIYALSWLVFAKRFEHRRCQPGAPERASMLAELKTSLLGTLYFLVPMVVAIPLYFTGHVKMILDPTATSPGFMVLSFVLFILGADTWFYWAHRIMHDSRIYRATHELHHGSVKPTPLASYSFSFIEGFVLGAYTPVIMLVLPLNVVVLWAVVLWFTLGEAYVHLGYEILPRWVARSRIGKYWGTSVFHNMHHENGAYNFGVYFTWWDRAMGTIHPQYTERYEQVTEKPLFWRPPGTHEGTNTAASVGA